MKQKILIVEDNLTLSRILKDWLENSGYAVITVIDESGARNLLQKDTFNLVLSDVRLPSGNGITLLEWMNNMHIRTPFIVMTEYASCTDAVRAIKLGACDYLTKPVYREQLLELTDIFLKQISTIWNKGKRLYKRTSKLAIETERLAKLVAPSDMSVLIFGENGTGKESTARIIHEFSDRCNAPFVAVNCGALPPDLAASLLFGHVKGAFTGAEKSTQGFFYVADGGTLFLDEIGTLPYSVQALLLRVLQEGTFSQVGDTKEKHTDVRIIAATNEDLKNAISEKRFREDLYHRICEFEITQPSLHDCPEDILPLANFFRNIFSTELKRKTDGFTLEAEQLLLSYSWTGNIRELRNRIKRAVLVSESSTINAEDLGIRLEDKKYTNIKQDYDKSSEKDCLIRALHASGGHRKKAAELLGINPATLYRKMNKYGLK